MVYLHNTNVHQNKHVLLFEWRMGGGGSALHRESCGCHLIPVVLVAGTVFSSTYTGTVILNTPVPPSPNSFTQFSSLHSSMKDRQHVFNYTPPRLHPPSMQEGARATDTTDSTSNRGLDLQYSKITTTSSEFYNGCILQFILEN